MDDRLRDASALLTSYLSEYAYAYVPGSVQYQKCKEQGRKLGPRTCTSSAWVFWKVACFFYIFLIYLFFFVHVVKFVCTLSTMLESLTLKICKTLEEISTL